MILQPFADFELADVKQFRFRLRAEAGMHLLAVADENNVFAPLASWTS